MASLRSHYNLLNCWNKVFDSAMCRSAKCFRRLLQNVKYNVRLGSHRWPTIEARHSTFQCPMMDNISLADVPIIGCHSIAGVDTEVDDRRDTRTHQRGRCWRGCQWHLTYNWYTNSPVALLRNMLRGLFWHCVWFDICIWEYRGQKVDLAFLQ